jgi:hypothetical protein
VPHNKKKTNRPGRKKRTEKKMRRHREDDENDDSGREIVPLNIPVWDYDTDQWITGPSPPIFRSVPPAKEDMSVLTRLKVALLDFLYVDCIDPFNVAQGQPLGVVYDKPDALRRNRVLHVVSPEGIDIKDDRSERNIRLMTFNDATFQTVRTTLTDTFRDHPVLNMIGTTPGRHWFLAVRECWMTEHNTRCWWEYTVQRPSLIGLRLHSDPAQDRILSIWLFKACKRLQHALIGQGPSDDAWDDFIFNSDVMSQKLSSAPPNLWKTASLFHLTFLEDPDDGGTALGLEDQLEHQRFYRRMKCFETHGLTQLEFQIDPFNNSVTSSYVLNGGSHSRKRYFDPAEAISRQDWLDTMKSFYSVAFNIGVCKFLLQLFEANREWYHYLWDELSYRRQ